MHFAALEPGVDGPRDIGLYELDASLQLRRVADPAAHEYQKRHAAIPVGSLTLDEASAILTDDGQRRWRLPRGSTAFDGPSPLGPSRVCREVATERDLFQACGTFFELPAENAGGFAKVRPVATHNRRIIDFCSYRGLFVMSGIAASAPADNLHVVRSDDGRTALWVGAIDDAWKLGKPRGFGGPWKETAVKAGVSSDPYLMTGYDRRTLTLSHRMPSRVSLRVECDISGSGLWVPYREFEVGAGESVTHEFPAAFAAYWLRVATNADGIASAQLAYE